MTNIIHPLDPSYSPSKEIKYNPEVFTDERMEDDNGDEFACLINYTWFFDESENCNTVIEYNAIGIGNEHVMSAYSFNESVRESIRVHLGGSVVFECNQLKNQI